MEYRDIPAKDTIAKKGESMHRETLRQSFRELSAETRAALRRIYPDAEIEAVESLSDDERKALSPNGLPSSNVHVQILYKFQGALEPSSFRRAVQEAMSRAECLRTNYCRLGREIQKVILARPKELPDIICQDLSRMESEELDKTLTQIMEANMRQEIDLLHGAPFRLSAFRTGASEYAILAATSQITACRFDFRKIFQIMNGTPAPEEEPCLPAPLAERKSTGDENSYWEHLLENLPIIPALPYEKTRRSEYRQGYYHANLPQNIFLSLQKLTSGHRNLLMSVLETAWGLLLLEINKCHDTYFPLLLPPSAGTCDFIRVLPIRFRRNTDISIEKTVATQLTQIEESMQRSQANSMELSFNHLLSFYDFLNGATTYSAADALPYGNIVAQNVWVAQGIALGLYFHYGKSQLSMTLLYDESRFKPYGMELLVKRYAQILEQALLDWKQPLSTFAQETRHDESASPSLQSKESTASQTPYSFLSRIGFMEDIAPATLRRDLLHPRIAACFIGDRIPKNEMEENCIFVIEGTVARNIELSSGWYNLLDLKKANSWINETSLLPVRRAKLSAEIVSEEATLLYVPLTEMRRLMNNEPLIQHRMLLHILSEMEKYQRLWAQM